MIVFENKRNLELYMYLDGRLKCMAADIENALKNENLMEYSAQLAMVDGVKRRMNGLYKVVLKKELDEAEEDTAEKKEDGLRSVIRCRQCKYYHEAHYEDPGDPPYIKHQCKNKYGMPKYTVRPDEDYCSRAEKKEEGKDDL